MKQFDSPLAAYLYYEENFPQRIFFRQPFKGVIREYTYAESGDQIRRIAGKLASLNLPPQSKIAILSKNCAHWIMADLAIMMCGHVSVPVYPTLNAEGINQILTHSESAAIIIGKLDDYSKQKDGVPDIVKIGVRDFDIQDGEAWEDIVKTTPPIAEIAKQVPENLITMIYTSGTTGNPKGVMHTVYNFTRVSNLLHATIDTPPETRMFSYLPLAHIAERIGISMQAIFRGATVTFPDSLESFGADLAATQPNLFFAVPRVWAKFQEKILEKMPQKKLDLFLKIPILNNIVKKKIRKALGLNESIFTASGAAPISVSLLEWFNKLGVVIYQVYGMTEDCLLCHFNLPGANKFGTVGKMLEGGKVKISPDGEICVLSDVLMKGYYKSPEQTDEMFDAEGFLRTGDIGEYDHDGFLTITGRFKDQFKTDKGKYVSPAPIELALSKNHNIDQICIVGTGIPQPIALITLIPEAKGKNAKEVHASLIETLDEVNPTLEKHERIEKFVIMKEDWTTDNGLLTPTLKVKRNSIEKIHREMYVSWFSTDARVVVE